MRFNRILIYVMAAAFISGCGTKKHLSRERGLFDAGPVSNHDGLRSYHPPGNGFTGRLNLIFEKKIKGAADSPLLAQNGIVGFRTTKHRFLAFDQLTGEKVCRIKKRRGYVLNPIIDDSLLVLIKRSRYGEIQVRNIFTGKVIDKKTIQEVRSGPIIIGGSLVLGATNGLLSLSLPEMETRWRSEEKTAVDISPVTDNTHIYYTPGKGRLKAVRAEDGKGIWENEFDSPIVSTLSLGKYLYFGLADGKLLAVGKGSGQIVWERLFEYQVTGGVAETDRRIYLGGTDGAVYCLSIDDGREIWKYQTKGIITAAPVIYGPAVLIGSQDRNFYSLDRQTGELIDKQQLEGAVVYSAAIDNHRIFVACRENRLYCFQGD